MLCITEMNADVHWSNKVERIYSKAHVWLYCVCIDSCLEPACNIVVALQCEFIIAGPGACLCKSGLRIQTHIVGPLLCHLLSVNVCLYSQLYPPDGPIVQTHIVGPLLCHLLYVNVCLYSQLWCTPEYKNTLWGHHYVIFCLWTWRAQYSWTCAQTATTNTHYRALGSLGVGVRREMFLPVLFGFPKKGLFLEEGPFSMYNI